MKNFKMFTIAIVFAMIGDSFAQWFPLPDSVYNNWGIAWCIDATDENSSVLSIILEDIGSKLYKLNYVDYSSKDITPPGIESPEGIIDVSVIDDQHIWCVTSASRIFATTDGGEAWIEQFADVQLTPFINFIEMFDLNNGIVMADAVDYENDPAVFLKTTDGGQSWISMNNTAFGGLSGDTWRRVDFVSPMVGYFAPSGGAYDQKIFKTIDGGTTWTETNFNCNIGLPRIVKFFNENIGLVYNLDYYNTGDRGVIHRTIDGGDTWEKFTMAGNSWGTDMEFIPNDPSIVWFCDYYSLFFSTDTGKTWTMQSAPTDTLMGRDIVFTDEKNGRLLCEDNGSYKILITSNNGGIVTDIKKEENNEVPQEFKLLQNYPNPFNPLTTIKFAIPKREHVELSVFNTLGQQIDILVSEELTEGSYETEFSGSNLSSGIYYYILKTSNYRDVKKMLLLK